MSSRWLSGASALAARALRASSGAAASSSGSSSCSSRGSIGLMVPIEPASSMSSSFFASAFFSRRRAFVTSQPAARYLPPVSTGGPAMLDGGSSSDPLPKPELVERILSDPSLLPRDASRRLAAAAAAAAAARRPGDTGSPEAQVAALSQRIAGLAAHLQAHRQDRSSSRGLQAMLARRRKLLQYLRRVNLAAYGRALERHSLRDRYAKLDRLGTRAAAAATAAAAAGAGGGGGKGKKKRKK